MMRIDNRTEEQINYILNWLYTRNDKDSIFWRGNILSPKKLREKFDTLVFKIKNKQTQGVTQDGLRKWYNETK